MAWPRRGPGLGGFRNAAGCRGSRSGGFAAQVLWRMPEAHAGAWACRAGTPGVRQIGGTRLGRRQRILSVSVFGRHGVL